MEEFEYVVCFPESRERSRMTGNMLAKGYDRTGRWLVCVYEKIDNETVLPVTAYEPTEE